MSFNIGPALPPNWNKSKEDSTNDSDNDDDQDNPTSGSNDSVTIGPSIPPTLKENEYGPRLPPDFSQSDDSSPNLYGPRLPSQLAVKQTKKSKTEKVIGPALPPGFSLPTTNSENIEDDSSDDECIGPSLTEFHSSDKTDTSISKTFEDRAKKMKDKLLYKEVEVQKREDWMTQLPDVLGTKIGLGARTFSKKSRPSLSEMDRSGWTETPQDREKKEAQTDEQEEVYRKPTLEELATYSRNLNLTNKIEKFNETKRKETLLDIHKKNLKRKADQDKDKKEKRREFDRDKDLNIQKLDKDGANNIIARSKVFNSKFSHGSNHFL